MAAIPRHTLLNLGKARIRARDGRVAAGPRVEALRIAGTLALLANPTASGQFLAALPGKAPPASLIPPGGSGRSHCPRIHPCFGDTPPWPVATNPFPRSPSSDTIPTARRPPVRVRAVCRVGTGRHAQAGRFSSTRFTRGFLSPVVCAFCVGCSPDKNRLFVRRQCQNDQAFCCLLADS